ncbi:hypothetical protein GJ629_02600 [Halapricum sp. CBA1109]|uniref:DUF7525 family protein n=1 Tax=Halapricum sp. CBA1109 TaxID=2668068 RepID=UPI0012F97BAB|nr:hypothetical protein [Halapricum sp. CBA1109]MUV88920.1 hypothetical protein [Halapricum sp. CBA1109]
MAETATASDMGIGLSMLFGALAIVGAGIMYVAAEDQIVAAGGFGLAVLAGSLSIAALHVYDSH